MPVHSFPPKAAGVVISLVFLRKAEAPQVSLHSVTFHSPHSQSTIVRFYIKIIYVGEPYIQHSRKVKMLILLPGHGCRPQFSVNFVSPSHCFPPYVACITISRLLVLNADVPHVALHDPSDQGPNLQSTKDKLELLARL